MTNALRADAQRMLEKWETGNGLWLFRLVACLQMLCGERPGMLRDWLDARIKLLIEGIVAFFLCHAALRVQPQTAHGFDDPRRSRDIAKLRAVLGGALRRALKGRTLLEQMSKLRRVFEQRAYWIAKLGRRLRHGLTKVMQAFTLVEPLPPSQRLRRDEPLAASGAELRLADTS
ncbi:MAG: hypothetical protein ABWZ40_01085 [Caulobacterales bacterium]